MSTRSGKHLVAFGPFTEFIVYGTMVGILTNSAPALRKVAVFISAL